MIWGVLSAAVPLSHPSLACASCAPRVKARAAAFDAFDRVQERRSALGVSRKYARDGKMARADGAAGGHRGIH